MCECVRGCVCECKWVRMCGWVGVCMCVREVGELTVHKMPHLYSYYICHDCWRKERREARGKKILWLVFTLGAPAVASVSHTRGKKWNYFSPVLDTSSFSAPFWRATNLLLVKLERRLTLFLPKKLILAGKAGSLEFYFRLKIRKFISTHKLSYSDSIFQHSTKIEQYF